jgi:hypothetical protein
VDAPLDMVPAEWMPAILSVVTLLIAIRSLLAALVAMLTEIDVALDGRVDWTWVGTLADVLAAIDRVLDLLPFKAPFVRSKR